VVVVVVVVVVRVSSVVWVLLLRDLSLR